LDRAQAVANLNPQDKGDYYLLTCPKCKKRGAYLYKAGVVISCNRLNECKYSSSLWDYIQETQKLSNQDTLRELARLAGYPLPAHGEFNHEEAEAKRRQEKLLEDALQLFRATLSSEKSPTLSYLNKRGYSQKEVEDMELGEFPTLNKFEAYLVNSGYNVTEIEGSGLLLKSFGSTHRLVIPYRGSVGMLKGFIVRATDNKTEPKYLYPKGLKRDTLLGIDKARGESRLIAVEGFLDALVAQAHGLRGAVATGGSEITETQLENALRFGFKSFVLALDNDEAGQDGTERSIDRITKRGARPYVVTLPEGFKDPDELIRAKGVEAFKTLVEKAGSGASWRVLRLLGKHSKQGLQTPQGRDNALEEFWGFAETIQDPIDSKDAVDTLSGALNIPQELLLPKVQDYKEKKARERLKRGYSDLLRDGQRLLNEGKLHELRELVDEKSRDLHAKAVTRSIDAYTLKELEQDIQNTPEGLKTGYPSLDKFVAIQQGALTIVAGRPSHGKTTLLMNLLLNQAREYTDKSFFFFSYEESRRQIGLKLLNILSGTVIDETRNLPQLENYLRGGNTNNRGVEQGRETYRKLTESGRLFVIDIPYFVDELVDALAFLRERYSIGAVFVDYIQKVKLKEKQQTRQLEIQKISERLLETAKSLQLPIVLGAQFNRQAGEEPKLEHLREAGDIEQDANLVLGLYNESMQKAQDIGETLRERAVDLKVTILKNRNGAVNEQTTLRFDRPILTITDPGTQNGGKW